jgi:hypothetical protein
MTTVRQIERCWNAKEYRKLFRELVAARPEGILRLEVEVRAPLAAAMAVIRLDELSQAHVPLCGRLIRAILGAQEADGGWGEPVTTALCLRALLCGQGEGSAVDRGMEYLANLQKEEGIWPSQPLRRMPADPHGSAFVLGQLADSPAFRRNVRLPAAAAWFEAHADELDDETLQLWERARTRCRRRLTTVGTVAAEPLIPALAPASWFKVA